MIELKGLTAEVEREENLLVEDWSFWYVISLSWGCGKRWKVPEIMVKD